MAFKAYLISVLLVFNVTANERTVDGGEYSSLVDKLLDVIIDKRIDPDFDASYSSKYSDSVPEESIQRGTSCETKIDADMIIRTTESQNNGAEFIDAPDVSSQDECVKECCQYEMCDLAVYTYKGAEKSCYLFVCGKPSVCIFSSHVGYNSIHLNRTILDKHEDELAKLLSVTKVSTTTTTTTPEITTTVAKLKEPAPLFGACEENKDCAGSRSKCLAGYCVCLDGYHAQEGSCRRDCDKFEFECANVGQPLLEPACIAIYDRCDGTSQCADDSDEEQCQDQDHQKSSGTNHEKGPSWIHVPRKPQRPNKDGGASPRIPPSVQKPDPGQATSKAHSSKLPEDAEKASDPHDISSESDQATDLFSDSPLPSSPNSDETSLDIASSKASNKTVIVEADPAPKEEDELEVVMEGISGRMPTSGTAVIVLALGLTLTAIMLIFVGCRLRTVKKRIRRGRPLNSNEADYLINGMYL